MIRKITLVAMMACTTVAWAQPFRVEQKEQSPRLVSIRVIGETGSADGSSARLAGEKSAPRRAAEDYGTVVPVMKEDFSRMTEGAYGAPAVNISVVKSEPQYTWNNMLDELTEMPGWGTINVFQAGGQAFLLADASTYGARINTPQLDVSGNDGIAFIRFKARCDLFSQTSSMGLQAAETNHWAAEWGNISGGYVPTVSDQWQTYEAMFQGFGETTIFLIFIEGPDPQPVYIDDVEVYQIEPYVHTPDVLAHTNYEGEGDVASFTANWTAVEDADGYLLNVYTYGQDGQPQYLLQDQPATTNSYRVENAVSGETYYYKVRATKGDHVSFESMECMVFDLAAPVLHSEVEMWPDRYYAEWDEVPSAEVYNYMAYFDRKATQDGEFVITDENFDNLRFDDGTPAEWTIENPGYQVYPEIYISDMEQAGWRGSSYAPFKGFVCLDAWQYIYNGEDAGLISPEFDLSKDGGKVNISVDLYGLYDNDFKSQVRCAVALFNWDEAKGDYTQAELVYADGVNESWQTFNLQLTKGAKRSVIGLYAVNGAEHLYLDNLRITQQYKAGESLMDPFLCKRAYLGNEIEVMLPNRTNRSDLYHKVSATKSYGGSGFAESRFSDLQYVGVASLPSGIQPNTLPRLNEDAANAPAYDLNGRIATDSQRGIIVRPTNQGYRKTLNR